MKNYIDFDYSSKIWMKNKIKKKNGTYQYKKHRCNCVKKNGEKCKIKIDFSKKYCYHHINYKNNLSI